MPEIKGLKKRRDHRLAPLPAPAWAYILPSAAQVPARRGLSCSARLQQYSRVARSSSPATAPAADQSQSEVGSRERPPWTKRRGKENRAPPSPLPPTGEEEEVVRNRVVEEGAVGMTAAGAPPMPTGGEDLARVASWKTAVAASPQTIAEGRCKAGFSVDRQYNDLYGENILW